MKSLFLIFYISFSLAFNEIPSSDDIYTIETFPDMKGNVIFTGYLYEMISGKYVKIITDNGIVEISWNAIKKINNKDISEYQKADLVYVDNVSDNYDVKVSRIPATKYPKETYKDSLVSIYLGMDITVESYGWTLYITNISEVPIRFNPSSCFFKMEPNIKLKITTYGLNSNNSWIMPGETSIYRLVIIREKTFWESFGNILVIGAFSTFNQQLLGSNSNIARALGNTIESSVIPSLIESSSELKTRELFLPINRSSSTSGTSELYRKPISKAKLSPINLKYSIEFSILHRNSIVKYTFAQMLQGYKYK